MVPVPVVTCWVQLIDLLKADADIKTDWRARRVEVIPDATGREQVVVTSQTGEIVRADAAVVTPAVPVRLRVFVFSFFLVVFLLLLDVLCCASMLASRPVDG